MTVAVNVPAHRDLVLGALAAGKHLYCEYPLGRDRAEAEALAEAARRAGVHAAIGLQFRANPATRRARKLIEAGAIGRVLSARALSTTMAFGSQSERAMAFAEKPENGVTLVSIEGAHTLDLAIAVLGEFAELSALASTQYPRVEIEGEPAMQTRVTPDHLLVMARLADGAPVSIEVAGGRPPDATPFRFEVTGQTGTLLLEGGAPRGVQSGLLQLSVNGEVHEVGASPADNSDTAANVAGVYAALRDDILQGTRTAPDFDHAVRTARLVDAALSSSDIGERKQASAWAPVNA